MIDKSTVRAVNAMTARWARASLAGGEGGTVFASPGAWPLIGLLAGAADGPARSEMETALGVPADEAIRRSGDLLSALGGMTGVDSALGLWTRDDKLTLRPEWQAMLPAAVHGTLTGDHDADHAVLDDWAHARTEGLIPAMRVELVDDTRLVLASALLLRTTWLRPFYDVWSGTEDGPWAGRDLTVLCRRTAVPDRLRVVRTPAGPLTVVEVVGDDGLSVHLVLGEEDAAPGDVLAAGTEAVGGAWPGRPGSRLPPGEAGPGVEVSLRRSEVREDRLSLQVAQFTVEAEHDLLQMPQVFGLDAATDNRTGHFPGVAEEPLAVGSAAQNATATFGPLGFKAAAVTDFGGVAAGVPAEPKRPHVVRHIDARFLRPFGFLAVHRASRLVLAAGWVTEPDEYDLAAEFGEDES
ncbi:serpin family protein [Streptomyces sp. NPDC051940]|uniref:serpin family protein n=1 Tax=Streptomyces sp. NPDC051940 TaxID=3155675 RepID=UPI0034422A7D